MPRFWLTYDSPNELSGFFRMCILSRENKRICCCTMEPTIKALSFSQNAHRTFLDLIVLPKPPEQKELSPHLRSKAFFCIKKGSAR